MDQGLSAGSGVERRCLTYSPLQPTEQAFQVAGVRSAVAGHFSQYDNILSDRQAQRLRRQPLGRGGCPDEHGQPGKAVPQSHQYVGQAF